MVLPLPDEELTGSNVLAMDYRGYGDSTGTPSEPGLLNDARAVYNYISTTALERGAKNPSGDIVLVGQSLGTGVVSALAGQLAGEGRSTFLCWSACTWNPMVAYHQVYTHAPLCLSPHSPPSPRCFWSTSCFS